MSEVAQGSLVLRADGQGSNLTLPLSRWDVATCKLGFLICKVRIIPIVRSKN